MSDNVIDCVKALQTFRENVTICHNKIENKYPSEKLRNIKDCKLTDEDRSRILPELSETKKKMEEIIKHLEAIRTSVLETNFSIHEDKDIQLRDNCGRQRKNTDSGICSCDSSIENEPCRQLLTQPCDDQSLKLTSKKHRQGEKLQKILMQALKLIKTLPEPYKPIITQPSADGSLKLPSPTEHEDSEA